MSFAVCLFVYLSNCGPVSLILSICLISCRTLCLLICLSLYLLFLYVFLPFVLSIFYYSVYRFLSVVSSVYHLFCSSFRHLSICLLCIVLSSVHSVCLELCVPTCLLLSSLCLFVSGTSNDDESLLMYITSLQAQRVVCCSSSVLGWSCFG